jgi:hypothetical protein
MGKAHLAKAPFKVYAGHLNAEQKRCLALALKQWVMYDTAHVADGDENANQTSDDVMSAGGDHKWEDADLHSRSSRSMSAGEQSAMGEAYGGSSPFHGEGQPVGDPTAPDSDWFTDNEGESDLTIRVADVIPGDVPASTCWAHFATNKGTTASGRPTTPRRWGPAGRDSMKTKRTRGSGGTCRMTMEMIHHKQGPQHALGMRDHMIISMSHYFARADGGHFFEREPPCMTSASLARAMSPRTRRGLRGQGF